ncbi:MAG: ubiquinol-cytochrome c reductase iron-sulfur subunit [Alphaproteobacteria bacterium]|nr:ubiquinol-cytochrome c reductase iron-sulfur subunit [Alphaproteobacteria bacterium]
MSETHAQEDVTRRDFIYLGAGAFAGIGAAVALVPLIDQMNPAADVRALATIEVDLSSIAVGQQIKVMWQGKPVFVRRRTAEEISAAENVDLKELKDPATDEARHANQEENGAEKPEWLIVVGICTHLGCIPLEGQGEYHGWFCPCHGSVYDTSGRIRKGPAPKNLEKPKYTFLSDERILIG